MRAERAACGTIGPMSSPDPRPHPDAQPNADTDSRPNALVIHIGHDELIIRRRYEVASIANDLLIAIWFIVGSVLFLFEDLTTIGTWLFIIGSVQLAIRPIIRLRRQVHLRKIGANHPVETSQDF